MTSEVELTGTLHCCDDADTAVVRHAAPEHIRLSRAEPGCLAFDLHETAEPGVWRVAERFVDRGAFEAHQRRTRGSAWWSATGHLRRDFAVTGIPEDTSVPLAPTSGRVQVGLSSLPDALRHDPVVVLDGGLGTHLERRGLDVSGVLWSAAVLRDRPDEVRAAHRDFLAAGAQVLTTCSYQLSVDGLAAIGADPGEAEPLLRRSVDLAREVASEATRPMWVAASIGPYGAGPGRGTEYDGAYGRTVRELRDWHHERLAVLDASGADLLLAETVPSIVEVKALIAELAAAATPAALSLTVRDGVLGDGTPIEETAPLLADSTLVAVGVNCCTVPDALGTLRILRERTDLPLLAYPNSGESWDHDTRTWRAGAGSVEQGDLVAAAPELLATGVRLLGGCCRVGPEQIARLAEAARRDGVSGAYGRMQT